jgi:phosphoribosylformylglycinamidine synthase I
MKPGILVLRAAGTNCDMETVRAFELAGGKPERVYIDELKKADLRKYQVLVIPGGFTYGDDIAAGKILANEIKFKYRDKVLDFIERGNLILGICNGFQVLVKCGILPAFDGYFEDQTVSLIYNDSERFEDRWIHMKVEAGRSVFTRGIDKLIYLPVAHAEGKFVVKDKKTLKKIKDHIVFQYVNEKGGTPGYPDNPNGSVLDIAGICDQTGRVLGLMPHPERHVAAFQHPCRTREKVPAEGDGLVIFKNAVEYFK